MGLRSFWILFAVSAGLMLSPENLVLLGQGAGATGGAVYIWLMFAIAVHLLTAMSYGAGFLAGASGEVALLAENLGRPAAAVVPVAARFGFALWGSAAVLVTAGYVFNETFVPAYRNGLRPFDTWTAFYKVTFNAWHTGQDLGRDVAVFAVSDKVISGVPTKLSARVGWLGFAWNFTRIQCWNMFGYPAAAPWTGAFMFTTQACYSRSGSSD